MWPLKRGSIHMELCIKGKCGFLNTGDCLLEA
jgi:hypothetical protein